MSTQEQSVFLFHSDGVNLIDIAPLHKFFNVPELGTTVIPCRPTSDDVVITFKQGLNRFEDITDSLERRHLRYEPTRGLVITNGSIQYHNEAILCTATRGNHTTTLKAMFIFRHPKATEGLFIQEFRSGRAHRAHLARKIVTKVSIQLEKVVPVAHKSYSCMRQLCLFRHIAMQRHITS